MKLKLFAAFVIFQFSANAQIEKVITDMFNNPNKANIKGNTYVNFSVMLPIELSTAIASGNISVPPISLEFEKAVAKNFSLGASLGYMQIKSTQINWTKAANGEINIYDALSLLGINLPFLPPGTTQGSYSYTYKYINLGVSGTYYFYTTEKSLEPFFKATLGYKFKTNSIEGQQPSVDFQNDNVNASVKVASSIYFGGFTGARWYTSSKKTFSLLGSLGYGNGYGDGVSIASSTLLLNLGLSYKF
jgi:hypothetical protein